MAGPSFFIILICLIVVPTTISYTTLNRILDRLDKERILSNRTLVHPFSTTDDCIPVEAVKQLHCPFVKKDNLYHELFKSICEQHQLCYACGSVHGISKSKCDKLSGIHMYELCSKNTSSKSDCLRKRLPVLILLEQDVYRSSKFSFECHDQCVLNYLYSNSNPK